MTFAARRFRLLIAGEELSQGTGFTKLFRDLMGGYRPSGVWTARDRKQAERWLRQKSGIPNADLGELSGHAACVKRVACNN